MALVATIVEHTNEAVGRKILLPNHGVNCPRSKAGPTFMRISALPSLSLAILMILEFWPPTFSSGPNMNCTNDSRPAKAHMAQAPYICRLNWTPMVTDVNSMNGLARVNLDETTSVRATRGSQGPSRRICDLHTGHCSGLLERSQSVTHESMQSW